MADTTNTQEPSRPVATGAADAGRDARCCAPAVEQVCCEPEAKASCCGPEPSTGCGCQ